MGMGGGTGPMTRKQMLAGHVSDRRPIPAHQIAKKPIPKETIHNVPNESGLKYLEGKLVNDSYFEGGRYMGAHEGYHTFIGPARSPNFMTVAYICRGGVEIDDKKRVNCTRTAGMSVRTTSKTESPYVYGLLKSIYEGKTP